MILKTFNSASELSFHLHCTEKLKSAFPDGHITQSMLSEVGWQSGIQSLLNVLRKTRFQRAQAFLIPRALQLLDFGIYPMPSTVLDTSKTKQKNHIWTLVYNLYLITEEASFAHLKQLDKK